MVDSGEHGWVAEDRGGAWRALFALDTMWPDKKNRKIPADAVGRFWKLRGLCRSALQMRRVGERNG